MQLTRTDKKWTTKSLLTKAQDREEKEMQNKAEKRLAFFLSRVTASPARGN